MNLIIDLPHAGALKTFQNRPFIEKSQIKVVAVASFHSLKGPSQLIYDILYLEHHHV